MKRKPTQEQQAVIDCPSGHMRLLAPPGTGKTDTIAGRVKKLVEADGLANDEILTLSFSRLAAQELGERVVEIRDGAESPKPRTLHSFALEQLRANKLSSLCGDFIIDDWEMRTFFRQDIADIIGGSAPAASTLLNEMQADWRTLQSENASLPAERAALEDALRALRSVFNFALLGELVYRLKRWADKQPAYKPRVKQMLVDEYQDLNKCEQELIELVQARSEAPLLVAGDDDQSIYGWRQADMQGIQDFPTKFGATDFTLAECWRCGQAIIDAAWSVVEQVPGRPAGRVAPTSKCSFSGEVKIVAARSAQSSPKDVAKLVQKLLSDSSNNLGSGDFLILVPRKNLAEKYRKALINLEIPAANLAESEKILDQPKVRQAIYLIRLQLNPDDPIALRALLAIHGGIGPARIKPMIQAAITDGTAFSQQVAKSTDPRVVEVVDLIKGAPSVSPEDSALKSLTDIALWIKMTDSELSDFTTLINSIMGEDDSTVIAFNLALSEFRVAPYAAPSDESQSPVRIMTMRQAKGLSAEAVIVTDLDDEIVPGSTIDHVVHEQRRLLYVSMTRAIRHLYLFYCGTRTRDASRFAGTGSSRRPWEQRSISRFLDGLNAAVTIDDLLN